MNFVNSWKAKNKDGNRINIVFRISTITFFEFYFDFTNKDYKIKILNLGIQK